jgi:hypothetical protein
MAIDTGRQQPMAVLSTAHSSASWPAPRRVGLANQLRDQLQTFWPGAGKVFSSVDSQIALAFLKRYPTPVDARGLGEQRLAAFLKRHSYNGPQARERAAQHGRPSRPA